MKVEIALAASAPKLVPRGYKLRGYEFKQGKNVILSRGAKDTPKQLQKHLDSYAAKYGTVTAVIFLTTPDGNEDTKQYNFENDGGTAVKVD